MRNTKEKEKKGLTPEEQKKQDEFKNVLNATADVLQKDKTVIDIQFLVIDRLVERVQKHEPDAEAGDILTDIFDRIKEDLEKLRANKEEEETKDE